MTEAQTGQVRDTRPPLGPVSYVFAALSIMPLLGFFFGAVAIVIGLLHLQRGGKVVAIIGAIGIASQVLVYVALIHTWFFT